MQAKLVGIVQSVGLVGAVVIAALLIILGVLILIYHELLVWVIGVGMILGGIALLASIVASFVNISSQSR
jgi:hypothetical protein